MKIGAAGGESATKAGTRKTPRVHDNKMEAKWTIY